jgi:hemerythrin-like domain-containing protein
MNVTAAKVLFAPRAAGFDAPFDMLSACHERVERSLGLLERLGVHLRGHGADAQARDAALDVLRYFDLAAPHHHEDEERHVLPVLRALGRGALADRLHADHGAMAVAWAGLRVQLEAILAGDAGPATTPEAAQAWQAFAALYRQHARIEDGEAFPAARGALDAAAQRAMGDEMARRRGARE